VLVPTRYTSTLGFRAAMNMNGFKEGIAVPGAAPLMPNEKFYFIKSSHGRYLSSTTGNEMRADERDLKTEETWRICYTKDGNDHHFYFQSWYGKYLRVDPSGRVIADIDHADASAMWMIYIDSVASDGKTVIVVDIVHQQSVRRLQAAPPTHQKPHVTLVLPQGAWAVFEIGGVKSHHRTFWDKINVIVKGEICVEF